MCEDAERRPKKQRDQCERVDAEAETPADKAAALKAALEKLGLPSGADFFLSFWQFLAWHEDTFVSGPTTAADYLASRKKK